MRIIFTYKAKNEKTPPATWMMTDLGILANFGKLFLYNFLEVKKWRHIVNFFRQFIYLVKHPADVYFCYFADYHSVLPVLFSRIRRKKSIVIVAGYDADAIFREKWFRRLSARIVYKLADEVLAVSQGLINDLQRNGVSTERFKKVPFGWDAGIIQPRKKVNFVLCVGAYHDEKGRLRKGIDRIVNVARLMPDVPFVIIGGEEKTQQDNVHYLGKLPFEEVIKYMERAKVYIQPYRYEGLCSATAEAMLAGCHVLTSDCHVMELCEENSISSWGWEMHPEKVAERIKTLLKIRTFSNRNRQDIIRNFPLSKRYLSLKKIIES